MRDNYDPDGPRKEWPAVRPPHPDTAIYEDFATRFDQAPAATRDGGLRRLSRLTWRTTQLSAVAAAAFAILFARTAPTQATSSQTTAKSAGSQSAGSQSSAKATVTPSPASSTHKPAKKALTASAAPTRPPTQAPAQPAAAPAVKPSSAAAPPPTLAPPTTAPAPAPSPSAVQSTSSGTHSGG